LADRAPGQRGATRLPGLLDAKAAVTIRAATLDYQGSTGTAIYTGVPGSQASISQGRTAIYGDSITIDQTTGDLTAAGGALSTMTLDGELSTGRAYQIRYVDATRVITFAAPPAGYVAPPAVPGMTAVLLPELSGSHGNINAGSRIEVELATEGGTAAGIKAFSNVTFSQGTGANGRSASGASTLTYEPDEQQYVMSATGTMLVKYVERTATSCREFSGRTLTFSGADDTIDVDGKQMNRASAGACAPSAR
jgi:lipopolysaccharide export system protein LptA